MRPLAAVIAIVLWPATLVSPPAEARPRHAPAPASAAPANSARRAEAPSTPELETAVEEAIRTSAPKLPKGASITGVRAASAIPLPPKRTRTTIEVTPPPRKAGPIAVSAVLVFWNEAAVVGRAPVTIDMMVPPEALVPDVPKGSSLILVVRKNLVEVSGPAVTSEAGDVGDIVPVLLRPSGRSLRAELVAKDRAIAVDDFR